MNFKKICALTILVCGICSILTSSYINNRVKEGKQEIAHAEKKMKQGSTLFSLSPATKELGKGLLGSAEKKIDQGKEQIGKYANLAGWLQMGGIILIVLGTGALFVLRKK